MIPTYPEYRVYDFRACDHCTDGLLVEVRGNIAGEIWSHTHCFQCGRDTSELVGRAQYVIADGTIYVCAECGNKLQLPGTFTESHKAAEAAGWTVRDRTKYGGHKGRTLCPACSKAAKAAGRRKQA